MLSDILDPPAFRRSRSSRSKRCGPNSKVPAPFDPSKVMGHLGDLTELRALVNRAIPFEPMQIGDPRIGQSDEKPVGCSEEVKRWSQTTLPGFTDFYECPENHFSQRKPAVLRDEKQVHKLITAPGTLVWGTIDNVSERGVTICAKLLRPLVASRKKYRQWEPTAYDVANMGENHRVVFCPKWDTGLSGEEMKALKKDEDIVAMVRRTKPDTKIVEVTMNNEQLTLPEEQFYENLGDGAIVPRPLGRLEGRTFYADLVKTREFWNPDTAQNYFGGVYGMPVEHQGGFLHTMHMASPYFKETDYYDHVKKKQSREWAQGRVNKGRQLKKNNEFERAYKFFKEAIILDPTFPKGHIEKYKVMREIQKKSKVRFTNEEMREAKARWREHQPPSTGSSTQVDKNTSTPHTETKPLPAQPPGSSNTAIFNGRENAGARKRTYQEVAAGPGPEGGGDWKRPKHEAMRMHGNGQQVQTNVSDGSGWGSSIGHGHPSRTNVPNGGGWGANMGDANRGWGGAAQSSTPSDGGRGQEQIRTVYVKFAPAFDNIDKKRAAWQVAERLEKQFNVQIKCECPDRKAHDCFFFLKCNCKQAFDIEEEFRKDERQFHDAYVQKGTITIRQVKVNDPDETGSKHARSADRGERGTWAMDRGDRQSRPRGPNSSRPRQMGPGDRLRQIGPGDRPRQMGAGDRSRQMGNGGRPRQMGPGGQPRKLGPGDRGTHSMDHWRARRSFLQEPTLILRPHNRANRRMVIDELQRMCRRRQYALRGNPKVSMSSMSIFLDFMDPNHAEDCLAFMNQTRAFKDVFEKVERKCNY